MWCFVRLLCVLCTAWLSHHRHDVYLWSNNDIASTVEHQTTVRWTHEDTWTFSECWANIPFSLRFGRFSHHVAEPEYAHEFKRRWHTDVTSDFTTILLCIMYCYYDVFGIGSIGRVAMPILTPQHPTACARLQSSSSIFAILILNVRLNGYAMPKNLVIFS